MWLHVSAARGHFLVTPKIGWVAGICRNYTMRQNAIFRTLSQLDPYKPSFLLNVSFRTISALYLNTSIIIAIT